MSNAGKNLILTFLVSFMINNAGELYYLNSPASLLTGSAGKR